MTFDYQAAIAAAAATSKDMNVASSGGDYTPPAEGACLLRLVGYLELGKREVTFQNQPKIEDWVRLVFELHGKNYPLNEHGDAQRISIDLSKSLNEKARFFKLFRTMNYEGKAKIFAELLGGAYRGRVVHRTYKDRQGKERVAVDLYDRTAGAFTIAPPIVEDAETGESRRVNVPPAVTPVKLFLWDSPSKGMWDSIYIDGEYPERKNDKGEVTAPARSKNVFQLAIKAAKNFKGSPIEAILDGIDDEALNSVGKSPEQAIAEKKEAAKTKDAPKTDDAKLPDPKADSASTLESELEEDGLDDDLPF
ncbi:MULTISPECIES: hypothetical protein [Burkholderia]|uniref:hypothetical protein n=1 Tax=Burkholderia TaxID=32008 RepID=UPI000B0C43D7|nr:MULTISPECIES: hypothetical protein [Burkholderia]